MSIKSALAQLKNEIREGWESEAEAHPLTPIEQRISNTVGVTKFVTKTVVKTNITTAKMGAKAYRSRKKDDAINARFRAKKRAKNA